MHTHTEENYLKALFSLSLDKEAVNVNDLSKRLDVSLPTVTSMMKKMGEKKLVNYTSYKPITLTEQGKKEAGLIIRKHRLTEMFLVEKMGFGWENVHDIAEQIEHIRSDAFFERMDELLGFPQADPHGSPIPDKNGVITWQHLEKLINCKVNETVVVSAVTQSSEEFLRYLNSKELHIGRKLNILGIEPFDKMMTVSYDKDHRESLSSAVCERLLVKRA